MKISVKHFAGQYPSFNVSLHTSEGTDPFIEIKGCRLVSNSTGEFISWPSRKQDNGKYWNHIYASQNFNAAVLKKAREDLPEVKTAPPPPPPPPAPRKALASMANDDDMPF
jgi:DNA-binding cell septation regulator SpoVG